MGKNKLSPPQLGQKLLSFLTHYEEDHSASGDYGEELKEHVLEKGRSRALIWYWGQVLYAPGAYFKLSSVIGVAMIKNYMKITWRNIRSHKVYSFINFINLSTARSNSRAKEIGMRKVVGAEKADIIRQFIGESIFLSIIALIVAIGFVYLFLPAFNNLAEKQLALNIGTNISTLIGLIGIVLFTGLVSGSYPAFLLSSYKPARTLKGEYQSGTGGYVLRRILVVGQFSATIILIIGTIIMYKQLNFIRNREQKKLGFEKFLGLR